MKRIITFYLRPYYGRMAVGFLIKFLGAIMDLFIPWILAYVIDSVIPVGSLRLIFAWGGVMLVCSILAVSFNIIANRMASRVASDATQIIRHDLFAKTMYLSARQTDAFTKPSLISRLTTDTYNVNQMIGRVQRLGVRAPILLVGGVLFTMSLDPVLSSVLLLVMPVLAVVMVVVSRKGMPLYRKLQSSVDSFVCLVREDIAGIRVIKALSKMDYEKEKFDRINKMVVTCERNAEKTMAVLNPSMNMLLNLGLVGVIIVGAFRVNAGTSEVGKILAFMTYFTIILNAMMSISRMFVIINKAVASAARIDQVLSCEDDLALLGDKTEPEAENTDTVEADAEKEIVFDHVSFSYNKKEPNLKDISFTVRKGEMLGIIGSTGSGKTTLASLLMRLMDVDEGRVLIGGRDVRSFEKEELRSRFGVVFQNDTIFEDTIYENVRMGRQLGREEIVQALSYAQAEEFTQEKERSEGGMLDIRGANLSGGQKQRVLIARALAARPEILILDDSSSALDYRTDAMMRRQLKENFSGTTTILIAQRISSVMHADHILVLEDGEMIGYGTHEELLMGCAVYREISRSQTGDIGG
ncbi:MAG TPA: ABC transporter ATP-binding protein/permease [Candidatus Eisenbergiella intestinigallinarum]|uniref:ABC transporter ATP-binding protein/permease n=1 Tax=Candidatus Eisenbergiella intestinigallinarum TaxID=2838549 RepID=A0A9D2QK85_9FIRM|nr:ABC transporter ATP-binding protein/permease [Candidatus Eisenbergiella intestinigallinarum]